MSQDYDELKDKVLAASAAKTALEELYMKVSKALTDVQQDFEKTPMSDSDVVQALVEAKLQKVGIPRHRISVSSPYSSHKEMVDDPARIVWVTIGLMRVSPVEAYNVVARDEEGSLIVYIWRVPEGGNPR